jgi:hypothetical protein
LTAQQRWNSAHPSYFVEYKRRLYTELRAMRDAAKDRPCADCGKRYPPRVMQFDHVRGEKCEPVSQIIRRGSKRLLLAEIEKCEVRCANCHALRHGEDD